MKGYSYMKRILKVVSVFLAVLMLASVGVFASANESEWTPPEGIRTFYAKDVSGNTPNIDGKISENEYGKPVRIEDYRAVAAATWGNSWQVGDFDETMASEYMDFYFAYDEENLYIAVYELGPEKIDDGDAFSQNDVVFRNNYRFTFGFDEWDLGKWLMFEGFTSNGSWATTRYYTRESIDNGTISVKSTDYISDFKVRKTIAKNGRLISEGDFVNANGNVNHSNSQWAMTFEFKIDKKMAAEVWNKCYGTDMETVSNVMYFSIVTNAFRMKTNNADDAVSQYFRWAGLTDITGKQADYADYGVITRDSLFDLVIFEDQGTDEETTEEATTVAEQTEELTTEAPTTEAEVTTEALVETTEAPETEAPTTSEETQAVTEAPTTEATAEEKGGCSSSIAVSGIALIATIALGGAVVCKKKED